MARPTTPGMEPISTSTQRMLRSVLATQPPSAARARFAWTMAAGPAMARATEVTWREDGTLVVRGVNDAWTRELRRARPLLLHRVRELLGDESVSRLVID